MSDLDRLARQGMTSPPRGCDKPVPKTLKPQARPWRIGSPKGLRLTILPQQWLVQHSSVPYLATTGLGHSNHHTDVLHTSRLPDSWEMHPCLREPQFLDSVGKRKAGKSKSIALPRVVFHWGKHYSRTLEEATGLLTHPSRAPTGRCLGLTAA